MSSSIYEKNVESLKKTEPKLIDYFENAKKQESLFHVASTKEEKEKRFEFKGYDEKIEILSETSFDGKEIIKIKRDDTIHYLNGKRNPDFIAEVWTEDFGRLPRTSPIIMFGIGDGTFLKKVDENATKDVRIFIYEPSLKIFENCIKKRDVSEIIERRKIAFAVDDSHSFDQIKRKIRSIITIENLEFLQSYILPGYKQLYIEEAKIFFELMRQVIIPLFSNYNTKAFFSNISSANMLYNAIYLPDCYTSFQLVNVIPRDMPAIVVAAGPSLNKNIQDLKLAKNKAFIIACDTALKPLLKAGIVPDMFAMVDGVKPLDLVEVPGAEKIPLLTSIISSQAALQYHEGKKIFYNESFRYINEPFETCNIPFNNVATGGSVATTAFSLVYMIGIDTVILVGQDLAMTGNKTHADGTFAEKMEKIDTTGYEMVPGNYEDEVPTRTDFKEFLDWYNYYIEGCKEHRKQFRVINATEGGARIENTEIMTLKEAIEKCCSKEVDFAARIEAMEPAFTGENRSKVVEYLRGTEQGFLTIAENARKQRKLYQKIDNMTQTGNISKKEYSQLLVKIKKLTKEILKSPLYQLVDDALFDANMILRKELLVEEDSLVEEAKEIARKGLLYMDLVDQCATLFADVATNSVSTVE